MTYEQRLEVLTLIQTQALAIVNIADATYKGLPYTQTCHILGCAAYISELAHELKADHDMAPA